MKADNYEGTIALYELGPMPRFTNPVHKGMCQVCLTPAATPFPSCNHCLDKPAWHKGNCCPHKNDPLPGSVQFKKNLRASLVKGPQPCSMYEFEGSSGASGDGVHNNEPELPSSGKRTPRGSSRSTPSASSSGKGGRATSTDGQAGRAGKGKFSKTFCAAKASHLDSPRTHVQECQEDCRPHITWP